MRAYIHYGEYDYAKQYPTLIVQGENMSSGYEIDPDTGEIIKQVCICFARDEWECCCSYDWGKFGNEREGE